MEKIVGCLTANAEATEVNGSIVINFRIAENRSYRDHTGELKTRTRFFKCKYWTKTDKLAKHLIKGKVVEVDGVITAEAYIKDKGKATAEAVGVLVVYVAELHLHGKPEKNAKTPGDDTTVI